jgi:hypothetical protein
MRASPEIGSTIVGGVVEVKVVVEPLARRIREA